MDVENMEAWWDCRIGSCDGLRHEEGAKDGSPIIEAPHGLSVDISFSRDSFGFVKTGLSGHSPLMRVPPRVLS